LSQLKPKISIRIISKKLLRSKYFPKQSAQCLLPLRRIFKVNSHYNLQSVNALLSILLFCIFTGSVHAKTEWQHERELYKKARVALNKNQINQYHQYLSQLADYPLYSYLVYSELRKRISSLSDKDVDLFLNANSNSPLASRLRLAWLSQLQRKGRSDSFLKYYQDDSAANLQCYFLRNFLTVNRVRRNFG